MSAIVEATVPATQFALGETLAQLPTVEFRMVRLVAHGAGDVMPFLWADCEDVDRVYDVVSADRSVGNVELLAAFDDECLLRLDWDARVRLLAFVVGEGDATVLDAVGDDGEWTLQIFFPDHERVSSTCAFCEDSGIDISIERIDRLTETAEYGYFGLTECQYETLLRAYERGYYDVPRKINQEELAEEFGISHQALSERLRRAHETVVTNALCHRLNLHRRDDGITSRGRPEIDG